MKTKFIILFVLSILFVGCEKTQSSSKDDFFLIYDELTISSEKKEKLLDSIYSQLSNEKNDSVKTVFLFKIAARYERINSEKKFNTVLQEILQLANQNKDTLSIAKHFRYKGDYYVSKEVSDSTFYHYSQSEKFYRLSKKDSLNWGRLLLYKGEILYNTGIYTEGEIETAKALSVLSKQKNQRLLYEANLQMAIILQQLKEYDEALKYYNQASEQLKTLEKADSYNDKIKKSWISYYNNLGNLYDKSGDYQKAREFYLKGISVDNIDEEPKLHAMLLNNYAYNKMLSKDYKNVDSLLFLSLKIRDSIHHEQGVAASKVRIGEYYLMRKDTQQAIYFLRDAYRLSRKNNSYFDIVRSLELLAESDIEKRDYYTQKYIIAKDSLRNIEYAARNQFARISYETEQITEENKVLIEKNALLVLLISGIVFITFGVVITYRFKLKNKELKHRRKEQESTEKIYELLLNEKNVEEEAKVKERNRISMELHDGIVNRIFTTRFNIELLKSEDVVLKNKLLNELRNTEEHVRRVSHELRDNFFSENQDFARLLEELVLNQKNSFRTEFRATIDKVIDWSEISGKQKVHVYRIIQEALQNINKYSQATKCFVIVIQQDGKVVIRIHDNGIGFNPEKSKNGLGLQTFEQRTKELKGKFNIKSEINKGTTIEISFSKD